MNHLTVSHVWDAYLKSQCRYVDSENKEPKKVLPFITISRQTGSGGITIGEKLVNYLRGHEQKKTICPSWTLFDRNLIETVLHDHNLPMEFAKFMPEDKVSETKDMVEELFGLHPSEWALAHKTSETILHLAQLGNVILVGRGANVITRKFLSTGFHVRLVGSLEMRIRHVQDYYHLKRDDAASFVKKEDEGRKRYLKQNFDKDIDDSLLYDVVINTDFISYDDAAKMIGDQTLCASKTISIDMNKKAK